MQLRFSDAGGRIRAWPPLVLAAAMLLADVGSALASEVVPQARMHAGSSSARPGSQPVPNVFGAENADSFYGAVVYALSASPRIATVDWQMPMSAYGIATDDKGYVYVASDVYPQAIYVFPVQANPSGTNPNPVRVLDDRGFDPIGVAVARNGTVIVGNHCPDMRGQELGNGSCEGAGNVVAYKPGATKPYATYANPDPPSNPPYEPFWLTVDGVGNVYVGVPDGYGLWKFTSPTTFTQLKWGQSAQQGLEVDHSGNVVMINYIHYSSKSGGPAWAVYSPSGSLLRRFNLPAGSSFSNYLSLDAANQTLYVESYIGAAPVLLFYNYQTGALEGSLNLGGYSDILWGIAANPPSVP